MPASQKGYALLARVVRPSRRTYTALHLPLTSCGRFATLVEFFNYARNVEMANMNFSVDDDIKDALYYIDICLLRNKMRHRCQSV